MQSRAAVILSLSVVAACASTSAESRSSAPVIDRIEPASGAAGIAYPIAVTVAGRNFTDSNVVTFGGLTLRAVGSQNDGTRLTFQAPKEVPSSGEVPPAPLLPGPHEIRVATHAGVSNAATFTLTPEREP
jgi:hypothetical protein